MDITMTQPAATERTRALSTRCVQTLGLPTGSTFTADWYTPRPNERMRSQSAVATPDRHHNSITRTAPIAVVTTDLGVLSLSPTSVVTRQADGVGFGAAKQAAPPRGVPR